LLPSAGSGARLGREVGNLLRRLHAEGRLEYKPDDLMRGYGGRAFPDQLFFPAKIWVNERYRLKVPETALMLAHEGTHVLKGAGLDGECLAWDIQCALYEELLAGNITLYGNHYPVRAGDNPVWDEALEYWRKGQIVDWIVGRKPYSEAVDAAWIKRNLHRFGGINKRRVETLLHYITLLADRGGEDVAVIMDVLEATKATPSLTQQLIRRMGGSRWRRLQAQMVVYSPGYELRLNKLCQETGITPSAFVRLP